MTITAHPVDVVGTALYSWDLDHDGPLFSPCETTPSTNPSITITRPAGAWKIRSCVSDDSSAAPMICGHAFLVGPKPAASASWPATDLDTYHRAGLSVPVSWTTPVSARYEARYTPAGPGWQTPLTVPSSVTKAADGSDLVRIEPPPPEAIRPYTPGVDRPAMLVLGPIATAEPYAGLLELPGGFSLMVTDFGAYSRLGGAPQTGGGTEPEVGAISRALDPKTRLAGVRRAGRTLTIRIAPGAAGGRLAKLRIRYLTPAGSRSAVRTVRLRPSQTSVGWTLPPKIWRSGRAWLRVTVSFTTASGTTYRTPGRAKELRVAWRSR
ncbi:hypothetical protein [Miltoncostaea oceani]|uniref:hypothetical protein n=1 Tax=Miltoncostaea oceani TaxID=2843216 RepID=UPI001C3DE06A|nr:hypothetical protein [Miltoncostaea oceani]